MKEISESQNSWHFPPLSFKPLRIKHHSKGVIGASESVQHRCVLFRPGDRAPESFSYEKPLEASFPFSLGQHLTLHFSLHGYGLAKSQRHRFIELFGF